MSSESAKEDREENKPVGVEEAGAAGVACEEPLAEAASEESAGVGAVIDEAGSVSEEMWEAAEAAGASHTIQAPAPPTGPVMDLHILYDRILVKRFPPKEKTEAGIYTPDQFREEPQEGRVLMIGEGRPLGRVRFSSPNGVPSDPYMETAPLKVRPGDVVVFGKHSGVAIEVSGETLLLLREDEILAYWRERATMVDLGAPADLTSEG